MGRGYLSPVALLVPLVLGACSGAAGSAKGTNQPAGGDSAAKSSNPLFPERKTGWATVGRQTDAEIGSLAQDYLEFLSHKTGRAALDQLVDSARSAGAREADPDAQPKTGDRLIWSESGRYAVIAQVGSQPIDQGVRVILADLDAPFIELSTEPLTTRGGVSVLDTSVQGGLDMHAWLVHPLSLHVFASGGGKQGGDLSVVIGESDGDPTFSLPDILPHLSRSEQNKRIAQRPELMDAITGRGATAVRDELAARGIGGEILRAAETAFLPAGAPVFVGVDRRLLAGYAAGQRAVAFAAVRALAADTQPQTTTLVVVTQGMRGAAARGTGLPESLVERAVLEIGGGELDTLQLRQVMARSEALLAAPAAGDRGRGVVLSNRRDDALPVAFRRARDRLWSGGAQVQLPRTTGWGRQARSLATSGMSTIEIAMPASAPGRPYQLLSTFDLYQLVLACAAWKEQA